MGFLSSELTEHANMLNSRVESESIRRGGLSGRILWLRQRKVVPRRVPKRVRRKVGREQEASAQRTKGREPKGADSCAALFLKQSSRSNYCGVYSAGMLLSLMGRKTERRGSLVLFNLQRNNPAYAGATHDELGSVLAAAANLKHWRWEYERRFRFAAISNSLRSQMGTANKPTLVSFGAIHKNGEWKCTHVAVVVGATLESIELLDPLGRPPSKGERANVWLLRPPPGSSLVDVVGNSYRVDLKSVAAVLRWAF